MSFNWPIGPSRRPDDYVSDDEVSYDGRWDDWESDTSGEAHMEEEDPSAFPFYKPDRDVFWPQSGWYQIKRRYAVPYIPPVFAAVGSTTSQARTPATPASVPLELHDLIADSLSLDTGFLIGANAGYFSRNHAIMSKSEMAQCALVCSSWALKCQPHLFRTVTLCSRQDLLTLLGFLDSRHSRVSRYIQYIEIPELRLDTMPWLHLVSRLYPRLRCEEFSLSFRLRGPLHAKYRTMHSIHYLLPRVNPATASLNIAALWLSDISVHSLGDLIQIIGEMPHLRNLHCTNVSWATVPRVWTSMKITTNHAKHFEIWMAGCTNNNATVWMFVALRRQRRESPSEDLELMHNLTEFLGPAITADAETASALTVAVDNHIVWSGERTDIGEWVSLQRSLCRRWLADFFLQALHMLAGLLSENRRMDQLQRRRFDTNGKCSRLWTAAL